MEHTVTLQRDDFSDLARRPASRETVVPLNRCRGRSGDMLVLQVRGASKAKPNIKSSLRSLGLGRPGMISLRFDNDVNRGYIRTARDHVAVAFLNGIWYKKNITEYLESAEYGTASKPAEIFRAQSGSYFGYEYSPPRLVMFMSTRAEFTEVLEAARASGVEVDNANPEALLVGANEDRREVVRRVGTLASALADVSLSAIERAVVPLRAQGELKITWRSAYRRFHDLDTINREIGIICADSARDLAGKLANRLMHAELIDAGIVIPYRSNGTRYGWHL